MTELQSLVDALARELHRPVTLEDWRLRLLAYSTHACDAVDPVRHRSIMERQTPAEVVDWLLRVVDRATEWSRVPPSPETGFEIERVCLPVRTDTTVLGYLWVLEGSAAMSPDELSRAADAARRAAVVLQRERVADEATRRRERELLFALLHGDTAEARGRAAATLADIELFAGSGVVALAVVPGASAPPLDDSLRAALDEALVETARHAGARRFLAGTFHDDAALLLAEAAGRAHSSLAEHVADELTSRLERQAPRLDACIGIGTVRDELAAAAASLDDARRAARVARALTDTRVASFDALGIYQVLSALPREALAPDALPPAIARLLDLDRRGAAYLEAVEAYLDQAGDGRAAAAAVGIHRTTLYYRLQKAEEHAGIKLSRGEDRLLAHVGIKLARLSGLFPPESAAAQAGSG